MNARSVLLLLVCLAAVAAAAAGMALLGAAKPAPPSPAASTVPAPQLSPLPVLAGEPGRINDTSRRIAESADSGSPEVQAFVAAYAPGTGTGSATVAQVFDVWEAIYANWTYVRDPPSFNLYQPAGDSIRAGLKGNCLDYAILNAAVVGALGGSARVIAAYGPRGDGHAYAELYVGDSMESLRQAGDYIAARYNARTVYWHVAEGPGGKKEYWLNLDWQAQYPGGPIFPDNGEYFASFPSGTGARYADNGTLVA